MTAKIRKQKGEADYDYKHDVLFFKTKNKEYVKSLELDNLVLDIDSKGAIVAIQIFEASKFLKMTKSHLRNIPNWEFYAKAEQIKDNGHNLTKIEVRLTFQVMIRNKLVEKNPIIVPKPLTEMLPNSEIACTA